MTTFKHILVPTDFGEAANHAIDVATMQAVTGHHGRLPSNQTPATRPRLVLGA